MSSASNPPEAFVCPITGELLKDPVVDPDGHTYERSAITAWVAEHHTSPITRAPLEHHQLAPNYSLRDAITAWLVAVGAAPEPSAPPAPAPDAAALAAQARAKQELGDRMAAISLGEPVEVVTGHTEAPAGADADAIGMATIVPSAGTQRTPVDLVCVIDVSGSMDTEATFQNAQGSTESHGLSLLDIVKHAVRTIIKSLGDHDRLSLVAFNSSATVISTLTPMNEGGKGAAETALARMTPGGTTNIWDGLKKALDILDHEGAPQRTSSVFLLTDGQPNVVPPRGHLPMLRRYKEQHPALSFTLNTFGFGYNIDSQLLNELSIEAGGSFAFIPDSGFVGTVFVHAISNLLVAAARDLVLTITPRDGVEIVGPVIEDIKTAAAGGDATAKKGAMELSLGSLHHGQNRNIVFRLRHTAGGSTADAAVPLFTCQLRYLPSNLSETQTVTSRSVGSAGTGAIAAASSAEDILAHYGRSLAVEAFARTANECHAELWEPARARVASLLDTLRASAAKELQPLRGILEDAAGQVTEAVSRADWTKRWGIHYLLSLARAHALQVCNNFKDPGVQNYGGKLFNTIRDDMDDIFCQLPPPKPNPHRVHAAGASAPVSSMRVFHNNSNPCFDGNCLVLLADGSLCRVADVVRGTLIALPDGSAARVECVVKTFCHNNQAHLVELDGGLLVTPYHPVRLGTAAAWTFPLDIAPVALRPCPAVYSFVLERGHVMTINGVQCVTLGHGFDDNDVVAHPYFGSQRIVDDLRAMDGWATGIIHFNSGCMRRSDDEQALVIGFHEPIAVGAV